MKNWVDTPKDPYPFEILDLMSEKDIYAPALRYLDLGWTKIMDIDQPDPILHEHPGFTKLQAEKLLHLCRSADVEMGLAVTASSPDLKHVVG